MPEKVSHTQPAGKDAINPGIQMIALEFAKCYRAFELYPIGHPQLKSMVNLSYEKILAELKKIGEVVFTVSRDGLFFEGKPLEGQIQVLKQLASELHIRQVKRFAFRKTLEMKEFMDFLELILIPAEEFRSGKKIENHFRKNRIRSIWVNEVDFGRVFMGQQTEESTEQDEAPGSEGDEKKRRFEELQTLVSGLDNSKDDRQALNILEQIEMELNQLSEKNYAEQWYLLGAISDFYEGKKEFSISREKSAQMIQNFATPKFLSWMVNNFIYSDENSGKAFVRYFDQLGEKAIRAMMERLKAQESLYFQKEMINYLKRKGPGIRPLLEDALLKSQGQTAIKIIYLLGELKSPESAPILLEMAGRENQAIRREAIRALGKVRGKSISLALVALLRDKKMDKETKSLLIQTLGEMQETIAVSGLVAILKNKREDDELREKSAEALGKIGSREALPALSSVLKKTWFFQKPAPERVQIKSAEALARIGGERVLALLEECAKGEGKLAHYCKELSEQIKERKGR